MTCVYTSLDHTAGTSHCWHRPAAAQVYGRAREEADDTAGGRRAAPRRHGCVARDTPRAGRLLTPEQLLYNRDSLCTVYLKEDEV